MAVTPETAKNIIALGLKVCVEKNYGEHIGLEDKSYKDVGVEIKETSKEVLSHSKMLISVNCPAENNINNLKENSILVGMLNPSKNKI